MGKVLSLFLFFLCLPFPLRAAEPISVVTSTTDLAAIAKAVGGERVKVESIAKGYQDPHYVEAKPSYMRLVNRARMLFFVGLQLEIGWLPLLVQGARNPGLVQVDLSQGISVLERPAGPISRAQGDVHPEGNQHYHLDPRNGIIMARRVAQEFKTVAQADGAYFEHNLKLFEADLNRRRQKWEERIVPFGGVEVMAYHKQWEYLANWLRFSIIGYVEDKPGIPPTPQHLGNLIRTMQQRRVRALLVANFTNPTIPQSTAEKGGAKTVILPASVGGEKGIESYGDLLESIIGKLVESLK
ncbi:MAG: zinc ABC transporter substrate-binding protein [Deltaproteobacteria bacterium]|nr:zinc ABC transporter substrate-binding protein [Deltaproteobacteria bacterium]